MVLVCRLLSLTVKDFVFRSLLQFSTVILENKLLKSIEPWVNTGKSGQCRNVLSNRLTKSHLHILHLILANLIMFLKPFPFTGGGNELLGD